MHVIGTAGHVDHGKSTLVQRLTGIDPDRFEEEKRRGLTIDLGFAWLPLPSGNEIGIVDVPGHERFIKNMLAGAGGISICLFVVAATEGWRAQSSEHLAILDILGITRGVVAVTKIDAVPQEGLATVVMDVEQRIGDSSLAGAPVVPCSAVTSERIDHLLAALDEVVSQTPPPPDFGRPRLWVDRVFTMQGAGTVVTGTLAGGSLRVGDEVEIAPEGRRARVRTVQSHRKALTQVSPGNRAALNLAGLERQGAERGNAVIAPGSIRSTRRVDALVRVLPAAFSGRDLAVRERGSHLLYAGSAETPVDMKLLDADELRPGESGYAELRLRRALPLLAGDRFVLRDAGRVLTVGGGTVVDPHPRDGRRHDPARLELLARLTDAGSPEERLAALVENAGQMDRDEAIVRSSASHISGSVVELGPLLMSESRLQTLEDEAERRLARYHHEHPLERGMPREKLRADLGLGSRAFDAALPRLRGAAADATVVRLVGHSVALGEPHRRARDRLLDALERAGLSPPGASELGIDETLLRALTEAGEIVRIGDFYLTARQANESRSLVRRHIEAHGPVTVAQIRDLLGTTRKYAVPLCEWLDATGATRRQGDLRTLGPRS